MAKPGVRGVALVDAILDLVIGGELPPGSRVTEPSLAIRFGVSRVPVREALRALAAEGFLDLRLYGSPTVRELTEDVVREVRSARIIVEPSTAREAALHCTRDGIELIRSILDEGDVAIEHGEIAKLHRLNSRFHDAIASACGNRILEAFVRTLSRRSEWINTAAITPANRHLWEDHHEIFSAIAAGEALLAEALMAAHVQRATSRPLAAASLDADRGRVDI